MPEGAIGPYQILGLLGAGGMGEVYKALDPRVGRQVALKLLPESVARDPDRRARFEREARLAASLNHPNIMAIYDVGLDQHPPFIVAELVAGESLRALIGKGPIAVRKAVDIAAQITAGLSAAHAAGIVHRDLKPENVIVTPGGVAKILDFGVARLDTRSATAKPDATMTLAQTVLGSAVGTAGYMSPEQARGEEVDYRSDQFALGLVLYEMLTGMQAFARASAVQTMSAIVEDDPPPIERVIPAQLRWVLARCLAKDRGERYESTRDLARELAQIRDHFQDLGSSQSGTQPAGAAPRKVARRRWILAAVGVAAAAAAWSAAQLLHNEHTVNLSRYKLKPFATALDAQTWPSWSPDGKSIAFFGASGSGKPQVYVQGIDAPSAVAITGSDTTNVRSYARPIWSPDSRSVYFLCTKGDEGGFCRAPAVGGETVVVQPRVHSAAFSPDRRTLALLAEAPGEGFRLQLMTASPPNAPPRPYEPAPFKPGIHYNNPEITFSPDGKQILIAIAFEGLGETVTLAPWPAGKARPVFSRRLPFSFTPEFSWMPDGRYAVFADLTASHHSQIYMADTAGGSYWQVFVEDRGAASPSVSPDGTRMAYESNLSHADVIAVPLGDGPVRTLLGSSRTEQMADTSPVGQQLVYVTDRRGVEEVWITSLAEGWDRPLFSPETFMVDDGHAQLFLAPTFSPDGRRVAVAAKGVAHIHVYTAFVAGGAPVHAIPEGASIEDAPAWSPDGNWLSFFRIVGNSLKLSKVRPGSGDQPIDVATVSSNPIPTWSPKGDWIAGCNPDYKLSLFGVDGKSSRVLPGDCGPVAWSKDGKVLYQVRRDPAALYETEVASGRDKKLRDLPGLEPYSSSNPGLRASLTADGKSIVYAVNRPRREIWILDGIQTPQPWYLRLLGR